MATNIPLENVVCPFCQSDLGVPILKGPDRAHQLAGPFTFCRCAACGLIYQNPRPCLTAFEALYPPEYLPHQANNALSQTVHSDLRRTIAFIAKIQPTEGRLLDVGCGSGAFLRALHQLKPQWELTGIEPNPHAVELARQFNFPIYQTILENTQLEPHSWDAITLWNVLEHLPNPYETLCKLRQLLRPKGVLYLSLPLCDSWDAQIFGPAWVGWELPRHFVIFNRISLQKMLAKAGFTIFETVCLDGIEFNFTESLRWLLAEKIKSYALRRLGFAVTYSRPFRFILQPYLKIAEKAQRCTVLTVAARLA